MLPPTSLIITFINILPHMVSSDISPQSFTPSHRHQNGTQDPELHLNIKAEHSPLAGVVTAVVLSGLGVVDVAKSEFTIGNN